MNNEYKKKLITKSFIGWICVLELLIHKGYFVRIKAFWYTIYFENIQFYIKMQILVVLIKELWTLKSKTQLYM